MDYVYREYTKEPLDPGEIQEVLGKHGVGPRDVLRGRDAKKAGLTGDETDEMLVALMAENPRLLQRPIAVVGERAVVARPTEALLELI